MPAAPRLQAPAKPLFALDQSQPPRTLDDGFHDERPSRCAGPRPCRHCPRHDAGGRDCASQAARAHKPAERCADETAAFHRFPVYREPGQGTDFAAFDLADIPWDRIAAMPTFPTSPATTGPVATTSAWSLVSWGVFGLAALATVAIGGWWAALRPAASDPHAGPAADVFSLLGMGVAWWLALASAGLGTVCGLIGVVIHSRRTGAAWATLDLNGAVVVISLILVRVLSP